MHYFLFVSLQRFYASTLESVQPKLKDAPLVVHEQGIVLDANEPACRSGISLGLSVSEARSIVRDGTFSRFEPDAFVSAQERWLDVCARFSDAIEPDEMHSAFIDLTGHPSPIDSAHELVGEIGRAWPNRAAIATTKWVTKAASTWRRLENVLLDATDGEQAIGRMPVSQLLPVPVEHRERLKFLGYRTIADVRAIPLEVLRSQFGEHALTIYQAARAGCTDHVKPVYPKETLACRISIPEGIDSSEHLSHALSELADTIMRSLHVRESQSRTLTLELIDEEGKRSVGMRTFTKPISCAKTAESALTLIAQKLVAKAKLPTVVIRAILRPLEPCQRDQLQLDGARQSSTAIGFALSRVRTAFGDSAVQQATHVVDPRNKQVLKAWKDATGWL